MRGIRGARWLLGENRRIGKATSSVLVFLDDEISFVMFEDEVKRQKPPGGQI